MKYFVEKFVFPFCPQGGWLASHVPYAMPIAAPRAFYILALLKNASAPAAIARNDHRKVFGLKFLKKNSNQKPFYGHCEERSDEAISLWARGNQVFYKIS